MTESTYPIDNPYQAPAAELLDSNALEKGKGLFVVSKKKLVILNLITFGLYSVVWFYQNFKNIKQVTGESIWPVPRTIFSVFYTHNLFKRIHDTATTNGISVGWSHMSLASAFVVLAILGNVAERISEVAGLLTYLLLPLSTYILVQVQETVNATQDDLHGEANSRFTVVNIIWCVLGVLIWALLLGAAADTLGLINLDALAVAE